MKLTWSSEAACRGLDVSLFFTTDDLEASRGKNAETTVASIAICEQCPVKAECLNHALDYEAEGIWGGTTPIERRHLRSELGIRLRDPKTLLEAANWHGTEAGYKRHWRLSQAGLEPYPVASRCEPCRSAHARGQNDRARRRKAAKK